MHPANINNHRLYQAVTALLVVLFIVKAFFSPYYDFTSLFHFQRIIFTEFVSKVPVLVLPVAIYFFYRRNPFAYTAVLLYLTYSLFAELRHFPADWAGFTSLWVQWVILLLNALVLALLLKQPFRQHFNMGNQALAFTLGTAVYAAVITSGTRKASTSFAALTLLLLFVIPVWDLILYNDKEQLLLNRTILRIKLRITFYPLLALIPGGLLVWATPHQFQNAIGFIIIVAPAAISYIWFSRASERHPVLSNYGSNFYFTVLVNYLLVSLILILWLFTRPSNNSWFQF